MSISIFTHLSTTLIFLEVHGKDISDISTFVTGSTGMTLPFLGSYPSAILSHASLELVYMIY